MGIKYEAKEVTFIVDGKVVGGFKAINIEATFDPPQYPKLKIKRRAALPPDEKWFDEVWTKSKGPRR